MQRAMNKYLFQRVTPWQHPKAAWTPRRHSLDHQEAHEESGILLFQAIPLPGISHILQREMWLLVLQFTALVTSDRIYNHNSGLKSK